MMSTPYPSLMWYTENEGRGSPFDVSPVRSKMKGGTPHPMDNPPRPFNPKRRGESRIQWTQNREGMETRGGAHERGWTSNGGVRPSFSMFLCVLLVFAAKTRVSGRTTPPKNFNPGNRGGFSLVFPGFLRKNKHCCRAPGLTQEVSPWIFPHFSFW